MPLIFTYARIGNALILKTVPCHVRDHTVRPNPSPNSSVWIWGSGRGEHMATLVEQRRQREAEHKREDRNKYLHRSDSFPVTRLSAISLFIPLFSQLTPLGDGFDVCSDTRIQDLVPGLAEHISQSCHYIPKRPLCNEEA